MKILITLTVLVNFIFAQNMSWLSFDKLETLKSDKIVLIEVMSEHCHYCKSMDNKVFNQKDVIEILEKNFINIRVDKYTDKFDSTFNAKMIPTFFFYDLKNREVIKKVVGSWSKDDFLDFVNSILKEKK